MILQNQLKNKSVVVGLSGGVDSAVAALLLKKAGARLQGVFMKNWRDDDSEAGCHDKQELIAAAAVAETLQIPFDVVDFAPQYYEQVFEPFLQELRRGRTPNPDVLCNSHIKFNLFQAYAKNQDAAAVIATGHYARIEESADGWQLFKPEDWLKDQTYFLHRLNADQLAQSLFPLAPYYKSEVRDQARAAGLGNWQRKDSTGICFIGERDFDEFIARYLPAQPGDIEDENGRVVGAHRGLHFYTIGQRRGLGIGGDGAAWFVAGKDAARNVLLAVHGDAHPLLYRSEVKIADAHWISGVLPPANWVFSARLRHRQPPAACTLTEVNEDGTATIAFAEAQRAVTPGQYAVIYDGNLCLGGGVIGENSQ